MVESQQPQFLPCDEATTYTCSAALMPTKQIIEMTELDCEFCKINTRYFLNEYIRFKFPYAFNQNRKLPTETRPSQNSSAARQLFCSASPHLFLLQRPPLQQGVVHVVAAEEVDGGEQAAAVVHGGALPDGRAQLLQQRRLAGELLPLQRQAADAGGRGHARQSLGSTVNSYFAAFIYLFFFTSLCVMIICAEKGKYRPLLLLSPL